MRRHRSACRVEHRCAGEVDRRGGALLVELPLRDRRVDRRGRNRRGGSVRCVAAAAGAARAVTSLLLDEMLSGAIAEQLRARDLDAVAVVESPRLIGTPDEELLAYAAGQERVLVTANIGDFAAIVTEWRGTGREHAGLVYVTVERFRGTGRSPERSSRRSWRCTTPSACLAPALRPSCAERDPKSSVINAVNQFRHELTIFKPLPNNGTHATNIGRKVTPDGVTFAHFHGNCWLLLAGVDCGAWRGEGLPGRGRCCAPLRGGRPRSCGRLLPR